MAYADRLELFDVLESYFYFLHTQKRGRETTTTSELKNMLNVSDRTLRRYKEEGKLQASEKYQLKETVFLIEDVLMFLEGLLRPYEDRHKINFFEDKLTD